MSFYSDRRDSEYYSVVRGLLESLRTLPSILDVGAWDSPVATWGDFRERYTLDTRPRPELPGVTAIVGTWPGCADSVPVVSVVTCLQVIEHIQAVEPFVSSLFAQATHSVIISVPYLWPAGSCKYHVHDPVGLGKLRAWTGRDPDWHRIADDTTGDPARLVAHYLRQR